MKKDLIALLLSLVMSMGILQPLPIQADTAADENCITGEAGDHVTCIYDKSTETITFRGYGKMLWGAEHMRDEDGNHISVECVKKIVIEEGITEMETSFDEGFGGLRELTIPSTVRSINTTGAEVLQDNYSLRRIYNNSAVEFDPRYGGYVRSGWGKREEVKTDENGNEIKSKSEPYSPITWKVNGKKVAKIPPRSVATGTPKKYRIKYDLKGGKKGKGRWITSYRYGSSHDLPTPKKKGYLFAGWKTNRGVVYLPTKSYIKLLPTFFTDVELIAVWRKVRVVRNKKKRTFQVLVSPRKYPQLTVLVSTKKNVVQAQMDYGRVYIYRIDGKGTKSKMKNGMRVFNIRGYSQMGYGTMEEKFKKGRTYYIWIRYGSPEATLDEYYDYIDDMGLELDDSENNNNFYFYKTKVKF